MPNRITSVSALLQGHEGQIVLLGGERETVFQTLDVLIVSQGVKFLHHFFLVVITLVTPLGARTDKGTTNDGGN